MPRLREPRTGQLLAVRSLKVHYSFWPARKTTRWKLQRRLYVREPWAILNEAVYRSKAGTTSQAVREDALSYLEQAEAYFDAGIKAERSVRPVLFYYSILNLAKCLVRIRRPTLDLTLARHGLAAKPTGRRAILSDEVSVKTSRQFVNIFQELLNVLEGGHAPAPGTLQVRHLLPQILPGHRLWTYACQKTERFLAISDVECLVDVATKSVWLRLKFDRGELEDTVGTVKELIKRSQLPGEWDQVAPPDADKPYVLLEQRNSTTYQQRPIDCLQTLFQKLRPALWCTVTSTPPHRQYYLLTASGQGFKRLPQWASMYVLFFYLSDLTRYRPGHFDRFVASKYGPQIETVLDECPRQFLYLMASELLEREVAPAAIIS